MPAVMPSPQRSPENLPCHGEHRLFGTALRALSVRILGPASSFVLTMLLARTLGAEGTGTFYVALTLMTAFATLAKFGLDTALQRFVGAAMSEQNLPCVIGIYHQALKISGLLALLIALLLTIAASPISALLLQDSQHAELIGVMGIALIPFSLLGVHSAMLKATGHPAWGGFLEAAAWPVFTLTLVVVSVLHSPLSVVNVAYAHLLAASAAVLLGYAILRHRLPSDVVAEPLPRQQLLASCIPLTLVELTNYALLWAPFLMLPVLADAEQAGLYNVSHRLAAQLGLLMIVFSSITAPRFAAHHQTGDQAALTTLAGRSTRTMVLFGLPASLLLLLWPELILGLFGQEFSAASDVLRILVAGQLFNLATGPVGYLLAMTGLERVLRNVVLATLCITLPLALILIPDHGAIGAAIAVTAPTVIHNLVCCAFAVQRLKLPFLMLFAR